MGTNLPNVFVWGCANNGQLGNSSDEIIKTPKKFNTEGMKENEEKMQIIQIACGHRHTLFLTADATVLTCGSNEYGQLGRIGDLQHLLPVNGLPKKIVSIAAGWQHSAAVTDTGQLYMWGLNSSGQCGHENSIDSSNAAVLIQISPHSNNDGTNNNQQPRVAQIACGRKHSLALLRDSRLFTWGVNTDGQLGLGTGVKWRKDFHTPQFVSALGNLPIRQIACGADHCVALTITGNIYSWGSNDCGQLGVEQRIQRQISASSTIRANGSNTANHSSLIGSTASEPVPVSVRQLKGTTVVHVSCGESHTAVLTDNGRLFTFGSGRVGQLGDGSFDSRATPCIVQELLGTEVTQIACGREHTLAFIGSTGRLYAFGGGNLGQLGGAASTKSDDCNNLNSPIVKLVHGAWSKRRNSIVKDSTPQEPVFINRIFAGGDHNFILSSTKKQIDMIFDMRRWNPMNTLTSIALLHVDQAKQLLANPSLFNDQFKELLVSVFASHACLSASFYITRELGNPPILNRRCHGVDIELADDVQQMMWQRTKSNEQIIQKLQRDLYDKILISTQPNYPDVECLRALLILSLSPIFSHTHLMNTFHIPFCKAINKLDPIPQSVLDDWFKTLKPRHLKRMISPLIESVSKIIKDNDRKRLTSTVEDMLKPLLDFLLKLFEINRFINPPVPASCFTIRDLHTQIELERDFVMWLQSNRHSIDRVGSPKSMRLSGAGRTQSPGPPTSTNGRSRQPRSRNASEGAGLLSSAPSGSGAARSGSVGANSQIRAVQESSVFFFCNYPFLFDGEAKAVLLRAEAILSMQSAVNSCAPLQPLGIIASLFNMPMPDFMPFFQIVVRRDYIIEDTLTVLAAADRKQLRKPLTVKFKGEEAVDEGGLRKEFFMLIIREIFNPLYGMFRFYPESGLYWFNESTLESSVMFGLIGQLCGLAIYNNLMVDLPFPLALFKKLMNEEPNLDDLKELEPTLGRSMQDLLDYENEDFEEIFTLNFEMTVTRFDEHVRIPLCPNGEQMTVTQENKTQFVHLYIDQVFNRSCERLYDDFHRGFHYIIQGADTSLQLFTPQELQALVVGNEEYDWQALRKSAEYQGEYWDRHEVIQWFWQVFLNEFNEKEKRKFLRFLTGCDRVPISGMSAIKIRIQPTRGGDQYYPVAHTCYNLLDLPMYSSQTILAQRLSTAIQHTEGFTIV